MPPCEHSNVRTNAIEINDPSLDDVICCITDMLEDSDDFVVFTPKDAINGVRFIQACRDPEGIELQISFVKDGRGHLMTKIIDEEKENIYMIFENYYKGNMMFDLSEFSPVMYM